MARSVVRKAPRLHRVLVVGLALAAGCKDQGPANRLVVTPAGPVTLAALNDTLRLKAQVVDRNGAPVAGQTFAWVSIHSLIASVDTGGLLKAKANGTDTVTVTAGSLQVLLAVQVAQMAAVIQKLGDNQVGSAGASLATKLGVQVFDSNGFAIASAPVTFIAAGGGGTVVPALAPTDASGQASATWSLAGPGRLTATASANGVVATFTATALPVTAAAGFQIQVVNVGPPLDATAQGVFDSAAAFWSRAITGGVADVPGFTSAEGDCGQGFPAVGPLTVDDVLILVKVDSIDGPGRTLAQAGPCYVQVTGSGPFKISFPISGVIEIDAADYPRMLADGSLNPVVRHELAHILGFGTFWPAILAPNFNGFGCLQNEASSGVTPDTYYSCARGQAVFDSIGGTSYTGGLKVPVENCLGITACGPGTFNSHWRESVFFNELMTGYFNSGVANPVSALTLAQMQDLGYTVNMGAAESYSRTFSSAPSLSDFTSASRAIRLTDDIRHGPIHLVDRRGRVVAVVRAP